MLSVHHLRYAYGEHLVLKDITFTVCDHEILAVLGRNGVGKTTLIHLLTSLLEAQEGEICFDGQDYTHQMSIQIKQQIGVMHPITGVLEKMTCYRYLEFVAGLYGIKRERIFLLASQYDMENELNTSIKNCSLGTRKKVAFIASILHDPKILFLDEPFESIDPFIIAKMKEAILDYAKAGHAVIIATHLLDVVENLCTDCLILHDGLIAYEGKITQAEARQSELERIFVEVTGNDES